MVLWKVLQLYMTTGPAPSVRSVELEHASCSGVGTCRGEHRVILPDGRLRKLETKLQWLPEFLLYIGCKRCDLLPVERLDLESVVGEPRLHLHGRVRVLEPRDLPEPCGDVGAGLPVDVDDLPRHRKVNEYSAVIDALAVCILLPDQVGNGEGRQPVLDGHLGLDIPSVVLLEERPLVREGGGKVPSCSARSAESPD